MPASTGNGSGKVWWGSENRSTRYDIAIRGDSVSLDDVNWVYPDVAEDGRRHARPAHQERSEKREGRRLQAREDGCAQHEVASHRRHELRDRRAVAARAKRQPPRRSDRLRSDSHAERQAVPAGLAGTAVRNGDRLAAVRSRTSSSTMRAASFATRTFPARSRGSPARGELDILYPAQTAFHRFFVDVASLDLRSLQAINPNFPRVGGTVSGTATLDSS